MKRISPTPVCDSINSIKQRAGQPPPGSSSSSARKPLGVDGNGETDRGVAAPQLAGESGFAQRGFSALDPGGVLGRRGRLERGG